VNAEQILSLLATVLEQEQRALIRIDLPTVMGLGARKAELVHALEQAMGGDLAWLRGSATELAHGVQIQAQRNCFLLRHLRGCLTAIDPAAAPVSTYGRDGRKHAASGRGGMVRTSL
jgi:hypothetical protein